MVQRTPLAKSYRENAERAFPLEAVPTAAGLEVFLFGSGELWSRSDGTVRRVATQPKALAVLVRLALDRANGLVRRDALLALLWPEMDTTRGRNSLSQAIHRLRRDLGTEVVVTHGHDEVGLSESVWCDVEAFRRALQSDDLRAALALYQGPLLAAFHVSNAGAFEQWLDLERYEAQQEAVRAALALTDRAEAAGRSLQATRWLRRATQLSPSDEITLRRLLQGLIDAGDRAGALRSYDEAAARLWVELEMEPARETRELVETLRQTSRPVKPEARRAFLRGRYLSGMLAQVEAALASFERAIGIDPDYGSAYAGLAACLANLAIFAHVPPDDVAGPLEAAASRAIELGGGLSDPHVALGVGRLVFARDWSGAERAFRRAVELDPKSAHARGYLALFLSTMGWLDEGVAEGAAAAELEPLDPLSNFLHAFALYRARQYQVSLDRFRAMIELYPHHALAHMFVAENALKCGQPAEAVEAARAALVFLPGDQLLTGICGCVLGLAGEQEEARSLLQELLDAAENRYINPSFLAAAHMGLGELDAAFALWERMFQEGAPDAFLIRTDPLFDLARSDARFVHLLERLEFPEVPIVRS